MPMNSHWSCSPVALATVDRFPALAAFIDYRLQSRSAPVLLGGGAFSIPEPGQAVSFSAAFRAAAMPRSPSAVACE